MVTSLLISFPAGAWGSASSSSTSEFVGDEPLGVLQGEVPGGSNFEGQKPRWAGQASLQPHSGPSLPLPEPVRGVCH